MYLHRKYLNKDTADLIGYLPHLRLLNSAEVITKKQPTVYNLSAVFDTLEKQNLDIQRKAIPRITIPEKNIFAKENFLLNSLCFPINPFCFLFSLK